MLSKLIRAKIEEKFGKPIRYAKDCEVLSTSVFAFTGERISCSTIKRLFGIIEADNEPRLYTLDVMAKYLGYINYDQLLSEFNPNRMLQSQDIETMQVSDLNFGDVIQFKYSPNTFVSVSYTEEAMFIVLESNDSKVQKNDVLVFNKLGRHMPLFTSWKSSQSHLVKNIVLGKISGITSIEKI
jgi:hypothetical protein